eukprot:7260896-Pyramimonas_sp.AAC.1
MGAVPELSWRSSSEFSNFALRRNTMWVAPSVRRLPMSTPILATAGGTLMAMVRARPRRPRCSAAACWKGITLPAATLIQACTPRTNSRKGT